MAEEEEVKWYWGKESFEHRKEMEDKVSDKGKSFLEGIIEADNIKYGGGA